MLTGLIILPLPLQDIMTECISYHLIWIGIIIYHEADIYVPIEYDICQLSDERLV